MMLVLALNSIIIVSIILGAVVLLGSVNNAKSYAESCMN